MTKTPIEEYFDHIYCLTLKRRKDRQASANEMFRYLEISPTAIEWVFGPDRPVDHTGKPNGNMGCTLGHRMILDDIIENEYPRSLVFEDDVAIAYDSPEMQHLVEPQDVFQNKIRPFLPRDWDMLYLGGQYADNPICRLSPHTIRFNRMLTTSSYGITLEMAWRMAPSIQGVGPIDSLYGGFQSEAFCVVVQPRLFTQGKSFSDLTDKVDDNRPCMLDSHHEEMLISGVWRAALDGRLLFDSEINRREVAAPNDLNGQEVIIDGETFVIESVKLPAHPAPWRRGESITYTLVKTSAP